MAWISVWFHILECRNPSTLFEEKMRMNYEKHVKAIYHSAHCVFLNDGLGGSLFCIFYGYNSDYTFATPLAAHRDSEELAWKESWDLINMQMIKKLES